MEKKNFNQEDVENKFNSFNSYTEDDKAKVMDNEDKILNKVENNSALDTFLDDVKTYFQMLGDFFSGRYKGIPFGSIAAIIGTLAYVLCPVDLIPDFIPVIGYLDDAAILNACLSLTRYDVKRYRQWKQIR